MLEKWGLQEALTMRMVWILKHRRQRSGQKALRSKGNFSEVCGVQSLGSMRAGI